MPQMRHSRDFQKVVRSFETEWAGMLALYLSVERKRKTIGMEEYFGALYLIGREILAVHWKDSVALDEFVRDVCKLTEPAWCYWIEFHEAMRTPKYLNGIGAPYSRDLEVALSYSARLALKEKAGSKTKQRFRVEHFLCALLARPKHPFTRRLLASGFELERLDKSLRQ